MVGGGRKREGRGYVFHAAAHVFFVEGFHYEVAGVWVVVSCGEDDGRGDGMLRRNGNADRLDRLD